MLFYMDFSRPFRLQSVILFTHSIRFFKSTPRTRSLYVTNSYLHTLGKLLLLLKYSYLFILKLRSKTVFIHKIHASYIQKIWRNSPKKLQNMQGQQEHRKQDQYTKYIIFLYICNKRSKIEIKKIVPFKVGEKTLLLLESWFVYILGLEV